MGSTDSMEDDLAWTAEQYVLGELSDETLTDFEARLAVDQTARDAVANAVQIFQWTAATLPISPAATSSELPQRTPTQRRAGSRFWFGDPVVYFAAAVFAFIAFAVFLRPTLWKAGSEVALNSTDESAGHSQTLGGELAMRTVDYLARDADLLFDPEGEFVETPATLEPAIAEEVAVPNWLVEAASATEEGGP